MHTEYGLRAEPLAEQIGRDVAADRSAATMIRSFSVTTVLICLVGVFNPASQLAAAWTATGRGRVAEDPRCLRPGTAAQPESGPYAARPGGRSRRPPSILR